MDHKVLLFSILSTFAINKYYNVYSCASIILFIFNNLDLSIEIMKLKYLSL